MIVKQAQYMIVKQAQSVKKKFLNSNKLQETVGEKLLFFPHTPFSAFEA